MKVSGIITLTTDFGLDDPYVGMMKGVILSINNKARFVDISHGIGAGGVLQASALLNEAYPFFPQGTVHVAVVDPGVGTERRLMILVTQNHMFVGPDNGIFWPVIKDHPRATLIEITQTRYYLPDVSHTFHGRDIFAPVAAHLSRGVAAHNMGEPLADPVKLPTLSPRQKDDVLGGQVIRVDHFGNLITNIHRRDLERFLRSRRPVINMGDLVIEGLCTTYAEAGSGEVLAMIGSSGFLEIAVNLGRASERVGKDPGETLGLVVQVKRAVG